MYIEAVPNRKSRPCILLRECFRQDGKVHKRTLANMTNWPNNIVEGMRILVKGGSVNQTPGSGVDGFEIVRSLPHGHVAAVMGTLHRLGLDRMIHSRRCRERDLVVAMIVARIIDPQSKLATARGLKEETAFSTLAEECGLVNIDEEDLYKAMDWLLCLQASIEKSLAKRHLQDGTLVLYDLTSSYFEGRTCPLAKLGHSRDGKKGKLQIEYGLLCDHEGRPVAIEVFEGNTGDPATLSSQITKIRKRFGLTRVVLVGDRGMLTEARIRDEIEPVEGLDWISALRGPAIKKLVDNKAFQLSLFDETDLAEITSPDYPGERLIVCRNPFLATKRRHKREELLQATEKKLAEIVKATKRKRKPLRGKADIGLRVGKVLNKYKVGKHFQIKITCANLNYERRTQKIQEEAALDGFYVVRTSVSAEKLNTDETVSAYKGLSVVERAFRSFKTVDLKVRPIWHHLENRVRAHVFLCMLAYYVEWHMRRKLAPLLFDDEDKQEAQKMRTSVVAQAKRSANAKNKAAAKRTEDDYPVHSFQTLLKDLATITKNRIQPNLSGSPTFDKTTVPTRTQDRAIKLLELRL